MKARGALALLFVAAAGAGGAFLWRPWERSAAPEVPSVRVERQRFVREIPAEGYLRAAESTPISVPREVTRPLQVAWLVEDGSRVKAGDVVVRFDAAELERELREGEADSAAASAKIAKERIESSQTVRARDRTASLAEEEMGAAREFELEDTDLFSRHEIIESQIDSELAAAKLGHASDTKEIERDVSRGALDVLKVEKRRSDVKIARAKKALSSLEMTAPHDGIVVLSRGFRGQRVRVGDTVWRGHKIAEIPLVEEMEAEVHVLEADAGGLAEGQEANLVVEAHPGIEYGARVATVEALAKPLFQDVPVQYFKVTLELERTEREVMKVGQRVRASIRVGGDEALVVPRQAVFERDGETVVYRRRAGEFAPVPVELGASTAGRVVLTSGIEEGEVIALRDPSGSASEPSPPREARPEEGRGLMGGP